MYKNRSHYYHKILEGIDIPLEKGDMFLFGKWKNKKAIFDHIEYNEKGEPQIVTDKGKFIPLLKIRMIPDVV